MDRDNRWDRTGATYLAMTRGEGQQADSALAAIQQAYDHKTTDEFILPTVIMADGHPVATVREGDAVIHYNFRPDRARQLTKAFVLPELPPQAQGKFDRGSRIDDLVYVMMTEYEEGLDAQVAYRADGVEMPLARVIAEQGMRQFHTAETEKYAHVTYFFNGGVEKEHACERRLLVPSPRISTYDLQPEMSAFKVSEEVLRGIEQRETDVFIVNFANPDMVGHTGKLDKTIEACQYVDTCLGWITKAIRQAGGITLITADHGNAEEKIDPEGNPLTAHTTNLVPFVLVAKNFTCTLASGGKLGDVAPTLLHLAGLPVPATMTGRDLVE